MQSRDGMTKADAVLPLPEKESAQLAAACRIIHGTLGGHVRAIYLYGSVLEGGLRPLSDLDILVATEGAVDEPLSRSLQRALLTVSAPPGERDALRALEVTVLDVHQVRPWRYPPRRELQFGEWLRNDLLNDLFEAPQPDHDLAILLTKVRQHSIALYGPPAQEFFEPVPRAHFRQALSDTLQQWNVAADWQGDERNVLLALARIWYSAATGDIAAKDAAAEWVARRLPQRHGNILQSARAAYLNGEDGNLAERQDEIAAFIGYAKSRITPCLSDPAAP